MCLYLPLTSLLFYWREVGGDYSDNQLLWSSSIAILLAIGLFFYVPIGQKIEPRSIAWGWLLFILILVAGFGLIGLIGDKPWGFSLTLLACFLPSYHEICRLQANKYKYSFFKAPEKL